MYVLYITHLLKLVEDIEDPRVPILQGPMENTMHMYTVT